MKVAVLQPLACWKTLKGEKFLGVLFILKNVLPVLANLLKPFQAGSVSFSQIVPLVSTTKATLEEILKTNSPVCF